MEYTLVEQNVLQAEREILFLRSCNPLENDILEECASSPDSQALEHLWEEMRLSKSLTPSPYSGVSVVGLTGQDDEVVEGVVRGVSIHVVHHLPRQERTPQRGGDQLTVRQS